MRADTTARPSRDGLNDNGRIVVRGRPARRSILSDRVRHTRLHCRTLPAGALRRFDDRGGGGPPDESLARSLTASVPLPGFAQLESIRVDRVTIRVAFKRTDAAPLIEKTVRLKLTGSKAGIYAYAFEM